MSDRRLGTSRCSETTATTTTSATMPILQPNQTEPQAVRQWRIKTKTKLLSSVCMHGQAYCVCCCRSVVLCATYLHICLWRCHRAAPVETPTNYPFVFHIENIPEWLAAIQFPSKWGLLVRYRSPIPFQLFYALTPSKSLFFISQSFDCHKIDTTLEMRIKFIHQIETESSNRASWRKHSESRAFKLKELVLRIIIPLPW